MRQTTARLLALGLPWVLAAACGGDTETPAPPSVTVRDSAGIRIVENRGPAWADGEEWVVASEPEWVVGYDDELLLSGVGYIDGHKDGRIAVAHTASEEVLVFSAEGALLSRFGRSGEGPGEFQSLYGAFWSQGDSLVTMDYGNSRISHFSSDGEFGRSQASPEHLAGIPSPYLSGALDSGALLFHAWLADAPKVDGRGLGALIVASSTMDGATEAARLPFAHCGAELEGGCAMMPGAPLGYPLAGGRSLYHAFGGDFQIVEVSPEGGVVQIARVDREPVVIDEEGVAEYREALREEGGAEAVENFDGLHGRFGLPEVMPYFRGFIVAPTDEVWVRQYESIAAESYYGEVYPRPTRGWGVFDPDGIYLGTVRVPSRLQVQAIGPDYLIGIYRDEYDVETIRRYRLDRG